MTIVMGYAAETIDVGANKNFSRKETTASVATVYNEEISKRSSKDVSNSLLGQGLGLVSLQMVEIMLPMNRLFCTWSSKFVQ